MKGFLAVLFLMIATAAHAVEPSEMLKDPKLEARARAISQDLRCLVCQNENIDDSTASLAHDLRVLLRKRLLAGDTDQQAIQYIVDRYGEFVLLQPTMKGANIVLWFAGPAMAALGLGIAFFTIRARRRTPEPPLTEDEAHRVEELMHG